MGWADRYIAEIAAGRPVSFRPIGNSMLPNIKSRQLVTVHPFEPGQLPVDGDIVLCTVSGSQYVHYVKSVRKVGNAMQFLIANARGRENGWTTRVHGYVVRIED